MAIMPDKKINHQVSGVVTGLSDVIRRATRIPAAPERYDDTEWVLAFPAMMTAEARMRPKKNENSSIEWCSRR